MKFNPILHVLLMNLAVGLSFGGWMQSFPAGVTVTLIGGFVIAIIDYAKLSHNTPTEPPKEQP